jgi:hypothetical protein
MRLSPGSTLTSANFIKASAWRMAFVLKGQHDSSHSTCYRLFMAGQALRARLRSHRPSGTKAIRPSDSETTVRQGSPGLVLPGIKLGRRSSSCLQSFRLLPESTSEGDPFALILETDDKTFGYA